MTLDRFAGPVALVVALGTGLLAQDQLGPAGRRQLAPGVETVVAPQITVQEQRTNPRLYAMEFAYKPPRFITVAVPAENGQLQRKRFWYLAYRVTNRTGEPRLFVPDLVLVTDTGKTYHDKVLPVVQKAIMQREDKSLDWKNSSTISDAPIPPTPEQGFVVSTYGIAIWEDVDPETDFFSIYVTGLSNGYQISEAADGQQRTLGKTLQLNFWRPGDERDENEQEIRPISQAPESVVGPAQNAPPDYQWIYR